MEGEVRLHVIWRSRRSWSEALPSRSRPIWKVRGRFVTFRSTAGAVSRAGASAELIAVQIRIAPDWYARLLKYNAERNVTTPAFVSVNETFRDFREMGVNGSRSPPEFRDPKFSPRGPILPGPMIGREVLGSALVTIENVTYFVFREAVQPFNFSAAANDSFSFITPRHRPDMNLSNGYAVVALRTSSGPQAILSDSLFYTESCPDIGWVGSGVLCRTCPEGAA